MALVGDPVPGASGSIPESGVRPQTTTVKGSGVGSPANTAEKALAVGAEQAVGQGGPTAGLETLAGGADNRRHTIKGPDGKFMSEEDAARAIGFRDPSAKTVEHSTPAEAHPGPGAGPDGGSEPEVDTTTQREPNSPNEQGSGNIKRVFKPSTEWQEVPTGLAIPEGGSYRMDSQTGKSYARWDNPPEIELEYEEVVAQAEPTTAGGPEPGAGAGPQPDGVGEPEAEEAADLTAETARAETETSRPVFTFAQDIQREWAEAEITAGGNLSVQDRELFQRRLRHAEGKDKILNSSLSRVGAERALGGRVAHLRSRIRSLLGREIALDQVAAEARGKQQQIYKDNLFEPLKNAAKADQTKPYEVRLREASDEARDFAKQAKKELNDAVDSGKDQETINRARQKYEAANQHFVMIRDEKRKNTIKGLLKSILLLTIVSAITESTKQVKEGVQTSQQPQRR